MSKVPNFAAILIFLGVFVLGFFLTDWVRGLAIRRNILDHPNSRSSHVAPTPRGGGLAVVGVFSFAIILLVLFTLFVFGVADRFLFGTAVISIFRFHR